MLDLRYIKEHLDDVKQNIQNRFMTTDADLVVELYDERNSLIRETDSLRQKRNENAKKMKGKFPAEERQVLIDEGKQRSEERRGGKEGRSRWSA